MSAPTAPVRSSDTGRRLVPLVVSGAPGTGEAWGRGVLALSGRVVIISATVGQGHEGAARELERRLIRRGVDVEVHDYLDALPGYTRRVLRDLYASTVQYAPALFDHIFDGLERDGVLRRTAAWVCDMAQAQVEQWTRGADVVVTTTRWPDRPSARCVIRGASPQKRSPT